MHSIDNQLISFIVISVLLFVFLGIAILVLIDHKARIPGEFIHDPISIVGMRREHPYISFLTTFILGAVILSLLLEVVVVLGEHTGIMNLFEKEKPEILKTLHKDRFSESQRHFHNTPPTDAVNMGKKPVCFQCHGDYPHSKQPMIRTLLNMHTQFVGCMTCHTDPRKVPEKNYAFAWLNYSGIKVSGPHFGTSLEPDTGYLVKTDDLYSKIVVYNLQGSGGEKELLEITEENPLAKEFLKIKDKLSDQDKEAIKKRFHSKVMPKGRFCTRCHTSEEESYLPFRELGFSDQRVTDVTNLNIVGIVEKYRKFYIPDLFHTEKSLPNVKTLVGEENHIKVPDEELQKGRAWWRQSESDSSQ